MIKVIKKKSDTPPSLLTTGAAEIKALTKLSKTKLLAYEYKSSLYGSPAVKDVLKKLQHDKCCFCEATVSHVSHGDVEHFRPKAGWVQKDKDSLTKPGYYWLAYDFTNLFLSCQICNQKFKKNYFPLSNPAKRAKSHTDKVSAERPLLIDPGKENPAKFLTFHKEVAVAINDNPKGLETIKRAGLNRDVMLRARFEYLETLNVLAEVARDNVGGASAAKAKAKAHFKKVGKEDKLYSLMVRCNFPDLV